MVKTNYLRKSCKYLRRKSKTHQENWNVQCVRNCSVAKQSLEEHTRNDHERKIQFQKFEFQIKEMEFDLCHKKLSLSNSILKCFKMLQYGNEALDTKHTFQVSIWMELGVLSDLWKETKWTNTNLIRLTRY